MRDLLGALRERLVGGCQPGEVVAHRGVDAFALEVAVVVEEEVDDELRIAHLRRASQGTTSAGAPAHLH